MSDGGDGGRLGSPRFSPWLADRLGLFPLRPCVRFLCTSLRAVGTLPGFCCMALVLVGLLATPVFDLSDMYPRARNASAGVSGPQSAHTRATRMSAIEIPRVW